MKRQRKFLKRGFVSIWQFLIFFALAAFVVTNCFLLFFSGFDIPKDIIKERAWITFFNVIMLSALFTAIDILRRNYMVKRPLRRILEATQKIRQGDFSVRIPPRYFTGPKNEFDIIIEDFNKMAEELSGIETLRTDFVANVSHELKTPLAVIQNYSTMLQDLELTKEKRVEYAKILASASNRLSDLITNILKLSKLENQQIYPETKVYNLSEQICECLLNFEALWEEKKLELKTKIEEEIYINADAELLTLVWNNLFSNAVKFTEEGGCIGVFLYTEDSYVVVQVSDTGCGISPEMGAHIFEKFYQGDNSHAVQGNGLGLALIKRVVDIMQGEILVQSELGTGSTFTVKLRRYLDGKI